MRLATLRDGSPDGRLLVVSADGARAIDARAAAASLRAALDDWAAHGCRRSSGLSQELAKGSPAAFELDVSQLAAPLPRATEWVDGSAYLNHVRLVRRPATPRRPPTLETDPLVYQGGASDMLGPREPFRLVDAAYGLDFEAELARRAGRYAARHARRRGAAQHVRLLVCLNDWTYRNLVPDELAKGFGFFCSKPATGFAPFAVTPDELGDAWLDGKLDGTMLVAVDGQRVGDPQTGPEMHFSFFQLDRAHLQDAPLWRRHHPGQRHHLERRARARHQLPARAARARNHRAAARRKRRFCKWAVASTSSSSCPTAAHLSATSSKEVIAP